MAIIIYSWTAHYNWSMNEGQKWHIANCITLIDATARLSTKSTKTVDKQASGPHT